MIKIKKSFLQFFSNQDNQLIFAMFFPILIEQLLLALMSTVHSIMLARVQTDAVYIVSAVNLVEQLNQLAYALLGCVPLGATVIVSQYVGSGKLEAAKHTAEQSVTLCFFLAIAVTAVFLLFSKEIFILFLGKDKSEGETFMYSMRYMKLCALSYPLMNIGSTAAGVVRGTGDAKSPIRISVVTGIINAVVAGFCIYALNLNVYGAGIATIISRFFGAIVAFALLIKKGYITKFADLFKPKIIYIKQILRIGLYQSAENLMFQFGRTLTYRFLIGEIHIAANSVAANIFNLACTPGNSMSIVAMALVGRLTGAGDKKQSYKVLRNIIWLTMIMLFVTDIVLLPFSSSLIELYTGNFDTDNLSDITMLIKQLLWLNLLFVPTAWPASFVMFSGMKGAGDVQFTTAVSMISMWLVRVLFAYILGGLLGWGVIGVWWGMYLDWIFRGVFAVVRFRGKKWQEKSAV